MGFWDAVKSVFDFLNNLLFRRGRSGHPRPNRTVWTSQTHGPPAANPAEGALAKRRCAQGLTRKGKPLSAYRLRNYERLEKQITLKVGRFPWTADEARAAMLAKGIDPQAAQAYLSSSAARKLLE